MKGPAFKCLCFCLCRAVCRMLVPRPGIEPVAPAVEAWNCNPWTARESLGPVLEVFHRYRFQNLVTDWRWI